MKENTTLRIWNRSNSMSRVFEKLMFVQAFCDVRIYDSNIGEPILATKNARKLILILQVVNELKYAPDVSFFPYSRVFSIYLFVVLYLYLFTSNATLLDTFANRNEILNRNHTRQKVRLLPVFPIMGKACLFLRFPVWPPCPSDNIIFKMYKYGAYWNDDNRGNRSI